MALLFVAKTNTYPLFPKLAPFTPHEDALFSDGYTMLFTRNQE